MTLCPETSRTAGLLVRLGWLACLIALIGLVGCAALPSPAQRRLYADARAASQGWQSLMLPAGKFVLAAYGTPQGGQGDVLTVYIEGDGAAWDNRYTPSADPTPVRPIGLELALAHRAGPVAYLARPCQFVAAADGRGCNTTYWTDGRFAPEVIVATDQAVDALKQRAGARRLVLVGYSGGAAVAALVASGRRDVDRLVTVAGNLDHATWTHLHGVTPLASSLNPAHAWRALSGLAQVHFVGGRDKVMDGRVAAAYVANFPAPGPRIITMDEFDHVCCWADAWPRLQQQAFGDAR